MQPDPIILNFLLSLDAAEMSAGLNSDLVPDSESTFRKTKASPSMASPSIMYQAFLEAYYILGPVLGTGNTMIIKA